MNINFTIELNQSEYYGEYLMVEGIRICKQQFASLFSHELITKLYFSCKDGIDEKPFGTVNTMYHKKITISQYISLEYDNNINKNIFEINDVSLMVLDTNMLFSIEYNDKTSHNIKRIFQYIINCLEYHYPWLKYGFVGIVCFTKDRPTFNEKIISEFEKIHGTKFIDDSSKELSSVIRQDTRVHQIIEKLNKEDKYPVYLIPKYLIGCAEMKISNNQNEYIHFDKNTAFETFVSSIIKPWEGALKLSKNEAYDTIYNFHNFISGFVVRKKFDEGEEW